MPFRYPAVSPQRRHGPRDYSNYESYRAWLRDEFSFRCCYCLLREQWGKVRGVFDLEHFVPVSHNPDLERDYENLVYACASCNDAKGTKRMAANIVALNANDVIVHADGRIEAQSKPALEVVQTVGLDSASNTRFRRNWIEIISLASHHNPQLYERLMGYPDDLPDLSRLRPPGGNSRPEGIEHSHFARRERGESAVAY